MLHRMTAASAIALAFVPLQAIAAIPEPVQDMIDAAIATGDEEEVETIIKFAKSTNPEDADDIEALYKSYLVARAEQKKAAEETKFADAGLFDNISGEGQIGAFRSTGNSSNTGVSAGLKLTKEGRKLRHKLSAAADYQRSNGITTREQFVAAYEPNYKFNDRLYAYGLLQYERDRFQGYASRYTVSGGLGYRVIDEDDMTLDLKAGPAYRKTNFIAGGSDSSIAALAAADFDWRIAENLKITEDASAYFQSGNSTFASTTGLEANITGSLSARFSFTFEHETEPPAGNVKTDTLSRFTLVYGF